MGKKVVDIKLEPGGAPGRFRQSATVNGKDEEAFTHDCEVPHPLGDLTIEGLPPGSGATRGIIYRRAKGDGAEHAAIDIVSLAELRKIGLRLYDDWLSKGVKSLFEDGVPDGLELRFDLTNCPQIADAPFELIARPVENRVRFLATRGAVRISRYVKPVGSEGKLPPERLDRVAKALLIGANPDGARLLDIAAEIEALTGLKKDQLPGQPDAMIEAHPSEGALIHWTVVPVATQNTLSNLLTSNDWDIIHFVGHGGFDTEKNAHFITVHGRNPARSAPVSDEDFGTALANSRPSLVFLNACGTGVSEHAAFFTGVARELVLQGIPYVVAMRADVPDSAARHFAKRFYESLTKIDKDTGRIEIGPTEAASLARNAVFTKPHEQDWFRLSFSIPVLYSSLPHDKLGPLLSVPGQALPMPPPVLPPESPVEPQQPEQPGGSFAQVWKWVGDNDKQVMALIGLATLVVSVIGVVFMTVGSEPPKQAVDQPSVEPERPVGAAPDDGDAGSASGGSDAGEAASGGGGSSPDYGSGPYRGAGSSSGSSDAGDGGPDTSIPAVCFDDPDRPGCPDGDAGDVDGGRLGKRIPDSQRNDLPALPEPIIALPPVTAPPPPPLVWWPVIPPPSPPPPMAPPPPCAFPAAFFAEGSDEPTHDWYDRLNGAEPSFDACRAQRVLVTGHTDTPPGTAPGGEESRALSQRRGERIKAELRTRLPDAEIYVLAAGDSNPLVIDPESEARSFNNRVEITEIERGESLPDGIDPAEIAFEAARSAERSALAAASVSHARAINALNLELDDAEAADAKRAAATPTLSAGQRLDFANAVKAASAELARAAASSDWTSDDYRASTERLIRTRETLAEALALVRDADREYRDQLQTDQAAILAAMQDHPDLGVEVTSPFRHPDDRAIALCDGLILRDALYTVLADGAGTPEGYAPAKAPDSLAACDGLDGLDGLDGRDGRTVSAIPLAPVGETPGQPAASADTVPAPITLDRFTVTTPRRLFAIADGGVPGEGSRLELRLRIRSLPQLDYEERGEALVVPTRQIDQLAEWLKAADARAGDAPAFAAIHLELPLGEGESDAAIERRRAEWLALVTERLRLAYRGEVRITARQCPWRWTEREADTALPVTGAGGAAISVIPKDVVLLLDQCPATGDPAGE